MKTGIIAFCGSKGSGKSTSASIFKDLVKFPTEELAFAGHLKETCSSVFRIDMKYFLDPSLKEVELDAYINLTRKSVEGVFKLFDISKFEYDKHVRPHMGQVFCTPRSLLQYIGTEVLHPINPLIHVEVTLKNKDPNKLSIITDLRFPQEFSELVKRDDFLSVYVSNQSAENVASGDMHPSEQGLRSFIHKCVKLDNNGTISELTENIQKLIDTNYGQE